MPFVLLPLRTYQLLFFLLLTILLVTLIHRAEYFDEAWFAEQSFWVIRTGEVKSELFRGYNGWENRLYVFHKLFIYAGALVMSITGISVATSKVVSLSFGLLGGYLIWVYNRSASQEQQWLSVLLYFGCGTLVRFISVNRPETMCMALGFASYLALEPPGTSRPKPILSGVLAGLAALTHLNGVVYLLVGTIWLFLRMGWRATFLFALVGSLTLSFYGLDALLAGDVGVLIDQFRNDPATQGNLNMAGKLSMMVDYHQLFFHSENEALLSALVLLSALLFRKQIKLSEPILVYMLLLVFAFWILTKSNTDIYFLLFIPWLSILAARWLVIYLPNQPSWQLRLMQASLVAYAVVFALQVRFVLIENRELPNMDRHNALLATHMPHTHTKVIAPLEFFFGQMDNYQIRGLTYFFLIERGKKAVPLQTFFQAAEQDQVEYIISDHRLNDSYDIPINAPAKIGVYRRVFQDEWNTIYARQ